MSDVYVYYAPEDTRVMRTVEITVEGIRTPALVDIGHEGQIVGVELLNAESVHVNGQKIEPPPMRYYRYTDDGFVQCDENGEDVREVIRAGGAEPITDEDLDDSRDV